MNTTGAYTPLECLLLFQSLVAYGTKDNDFVRISQLLTNNALVKEGETYDEKRLTPASLQALYLRLLRDELNGDAQDAEESNPKKRKIQSPPLPSLQDAQEYGDKLPLLVDRLYARYREYMVKAIRDEEKRYAEIQREITEIENGDWDEKILKEDRGLANGSASPDSSRPRANGVTAPDIPQQGDVSKAAETVPKASPLQPPNPDAKPEGQPIPDALNSQKAPSSPRAIQNQPRLGSQENFPPSHRNGSNTPQHVPLHPAPHPVQAVPPQNYGWAPPYQPGLPQQYNNQYPLQYPQHHRPSLPSSHHLPPQFPVPSSPVHGQHQQPPNQMSIAHPHQGRQSNSPGVQLNALADAAGQHGQPAQYQRGNSASPLVPQGQPTFPPHFQQQRPPNGQYPPAWQAAPINHAAPHYPQNFQQPPFVPSHMPQSPYHPPPPMIQPGTPAAYTSPYNPSQGKRPSHPGVLRSQPGTPKTSRPSYSTGFGTKWTPTPTPQTPGPYVEVKKPEVEPISPIPQRAELPAQAKAPGKRAREPEPKSKASQRGTKRARAESTTSSIIAGSRRSQSVLSHVDELSMDDPPTRQVKQEVATPIGVEDAEDAPTMDSSAQPQLPPHRQNKRKRGVSGVESISPHIPPTHVLWTKAFPKISASALEAVSGHKNASTFSQPVKERDAPGYSSIILRPQDLKSIRSAISAGHRAATAAAPADLTPSASSCWLPVSDDLIPPKGIINYAQLEKELMRMFANAIMFNPDPDRGFGKRWEHIGKEKGENVGYEIDEDGVVKDTKSMYADIEKIVGSLRSAERKSEELRESSIAIRDTEEDDIDELAGDGESVAESHSGSVAKRRRKA